MTMSLAEIVITNVFLFLLSNAGVTVREYLLGNKDGVCAIN